MINRDKIYFIFGVHNHQPIGNFDFIFERACKEAYRPFLNILLAFPGIKLTMHTSGCLWDYFLEHAKDYIELVREGISRGQIEMLTGGYQEPLLPVIPKRDACGQLQRMKEFFLKDLIYEPSGIWLTERVWEQNIPDLLPPYIKYTFLDDYHFITSGKDKEDLNKAYLTDYNGKTLVVFPIDERLRYLVPFKPLKETLEYLRQIRESNDYGGLAVLVDDGEKFGLWPGTYDWVYTRGYLRDFLNALQDNSDWIETILPSEYIKLFPPEDNIYFASTAYREMGEWALDAVAAEKYKELYSSIPRETALPFVRGGYWRGFLTKYTEGFNLYKRMLLTSEDLAEAEEAGELSTTEIEGAKDSLYKAQCNCAYWHGVFGGLYLNYLRHGIYKNLIEADRVLNRQNGFSWQERFITYPYIKAFRGIGRLTELILYPQKGGNLVELSFFPISFNLLNVLSRRYEAYHERLKTIGKNGIESDHRSIHELDISKTKRRFEDLVFDDEPLYSMKDYIFNTQVHFYDFEENTKVFKEASMSSQGYKACIEGEALRLSSDRVINNHRMTIDKRLIVDEDKDSERVVIRIEYRLVFDGSLESDLIFGSMWNLSLLSPDASDRYFMLPSYDEKRYPMNYKGSWQKQKSILFTDEYMGLDMEMSLKNPCQIWSAPIYTVSLSESGIEDTYQGSSFMFLIPVRSGEEKLDTEIEIEIKKREK